MHLVDEMFHEIMTTPLRDLVSGGDTVQARWEGLMRVVPQLNIFKGEVSDLTDDELLYLAYRIQERLVDMGLCPYFRTFFSKRNRKFHQICRRRDKVRTTCRGQIPQCEIECGKAVE